MLKIKDDIDLKELEKYGFHRLNNDARGHKYSWKRIINQNGFYELYIAKDNRLSFYYESTCHCNYFPNLTYLTIRGKLQDKLYDLIQDGLVEKVEEENEFMD